jgi:uncharacterized protein YjiS (DUF1127 family)
MTIIQSTHRDGTVWSFLPTRIPRQGIAGFRAIWDEWQTRRRFRMDLERLLRVGTYMIEDVGLTLAEAKREIEKPFWQV